MPHGVSGSSAGAINAVLLSAANTPNFSALGCFWIKLSLLGWPFTILLVLAAVVRLPLTIWQWIMFACHPGKRTRFPSVFPFAAFQAILCTLLPKRLTFKVYTNVYATDIDVDAAPGAFDSQTIETFYLEKDTDVAVTIGGNTPIPYRTAIAASCCLPIVEPATVEGRRMSDGGVYSNLPINSIFVTGTKACGIGVFVLATSIGDLDIANKVVDHRSLLLLRKLRLEYLRGERRYSEVMNRGGSGTFPPHVGTPLLLATPSRRLKSGLLWGFWWPPFAYSDYGLGIADGNKFADALDKLLSGKPEFVSPYLLTQMSLPKLRPRRVGFNEWWTSFCNRGWRDSKSCPPHDALPSGNIDAS